MKNRTIIVFAVVVLIAMIAEWKFVAFTTEARTVHGYHGTCNAGVGRPYVDFIHELRTIADSGDTNRLTIVLRRADERSGDIYDVWLANKEHAYHESIQVILK
jgi:hypothetical protein